MDGEACLRGVDLLELPPERLVSALTRAWVDWHAVDEDTWKLRLKLGRSLDSLASVRPGGGSGEDTEAIDDVMASPFPGVMRGGPAGVVGQT